MLLWTKRILSISVGVSFLRCFGAGGDGGDGDVGDDDALLRKPLK